MDPSQAVIEECAEEGDVVIVGMPSNQLVGGAPQVTRAWSRREKDVRTHLYIVQQ
jgi:hypothetical protein